ncbi:hypothetical protein ES703_50105 [subsurface metagenome]
MVRNVTQLRQHLQDPLYKNSYFLIGTSGTTALLGVVFWIVVARFYPPDDVGLATALISATGILVLVAKLGFDFGLMRYLPQESDKRGMLNSFYTIVGLFSLLLAIIFVAGLGIWSPALLFIQNDITILLPFIMFVPIHSLWMLQSSTFVGLRSTKFLFINSIITGVSKIPLPIVLVSFGMLGIFLSWGIAMCVSLMALITSFRNLMWS